MANLPHPDTRDLPVDPPHTTLLFIDVQNYCARRDIVHMVVETSTPVETLLLEYLRRRGLLR